MYGTYNIVSTYIVTYINKKNIITEVDEMKDFNKSDAWRKHQFFPAVRAKVFRRKEMFFLPFYGRLAVIRPDDIILIRQKI